MRIVLLPLEFKNLDEEEPHYKQLLEDVVLAGVLPSERLVKVLAEVGSEMLGVTDRAFYVLFNDSKTYYARATLLSLILSEHATGSLVIKHVVNVLRNSGDQDKPYIAVSLISESTPEHLFFAYQGTEDLSKSLADYGRQLGVIHTTMCKDFEFSDDELNLLYAMHKRFCAAVELLNSRCGFGLTNVDNEHAVCIRVGNYGFVLQRAVVSAIE